MQALVRTPHGPCAGCAGRPLRPGRRRGGSPLRARARACPLHPRLRDRGVGRRGGAHAGPGERDRPGLPLRGRGLAGRGAQRPEDTRRGGDRPPALGPAHANGGGERRPAGQAADRQRAELPGGQPAPPLRRDPAAVRGRAAPGGGALPARGAGGRHRRGARRRARALPAALRRPAPRAPGSPRRPGGPGHPGGPRRRAGRSPGGRSGAERGRAGAAVPAERGSLAEAARVDCPAPGSGDRRRARGPRSARWRRRSATTTRPT